MSKRICGLLDKHCSSWNSYPSQHCMGSHHIDGYPRLLFTSGISRLSNLKADDKVGIMICVIIASLQDEGKDIFCDDGNVENRILRNIIYVFEMVLCYRAFLKRDTYWKCNDTSELKKVQEAVEIFLQEIIQYFPRSTGNEWAVPKFHKPLHTPKNINNYGAPRNIHTGPQEHNHIENTKKNKQTSSTQKM